MKSLTPRWSATLLWTGLSHHLISWLREPGSLTLRGQRSFKDFAIRPVFQGGCAPLDEPGLMHAVREVVLLAEGRPFIFAHSVLTGSPRGPLGCWLRGLGSRSLGSVLFRHPGFQRGALQFARLDARHALYQACRTQLAKMDYPIQGPLWARRCEHRFGHQTIRVTEVFVGPMNEAPTR